MAAAGRGRCLPPKAAFPPAHPNLDPRSPSPLYIPMTLAALLCWLVALLPAGMAHGPGHSHGRSESGLPRSENGDFSAQAGPPQGLHSSMLWSRTYSFEVHGMDCEGCASGIEDALPQFAKLPSGCSMTRASVSFPEAKAQAAVSCASPVDDTAVAGGVIGEIELQGFKARLISASDSTPTLPGTADSPGLSASGWVLAVADGFAEACPWMLMGIASTLTLQTLSSWLLPNSTLHKHLTLDPRSRNVLALPVVCVKATLLGLVCPLCSCGAVPLAMGLADADAAPAAVLAFLLAAQSSGLDSAVMTWGLLGAHSALQRLLGASLLAVTAGIAVGRGRGTAGAAPGDGATKRQTRSQSGAAVTAATQRGGGGGGAETSWERLRAVARMCSQLIPPLFLGVVLTKSVEPAAAALRAVVPPEVVSLSSTATSGVWASVLGRALAVGSALPLQACEHSVAAFARALGKAGASPGTAFAFMLVAPATNLATVTLLLRHGGGAGGAAVCRAVGAVVTVAVALSFAIDHAQPAVPMTSASPAGLMAGLCQYTVLRWASLATVCLLVAADRVAAKKSAPASKSEYKSR